MTSFKQSESEAKGNKKLLFLLVVILFILATTLSITFLSIRNSIQNKPEKTLADFIQAIGKHDQKTALSLISPYERIYFDEYLSKYLSLPKEGRSTIVSIDGLLNKLKIETKGLKFKTELDGDIARMRIIQGSLILRSPDDEVMQDISIHSIEMAGVDAPAIVLVRQDGQWFISLLHTFTDGALQAIKNNSMKNPFEASPEEKARQLLRDGATAMESYYVDNQTYLGANAGSLRKIQPDINWLNNGLGKVEKNEITIIFVSDDNYVITSQLETGKIFELARGETNFEITER